MGSQNRLSLQLLASVLAMMLCAWLLPGVSALAPWDSAIAGLALALVYLLLRPVAKALLFIINIFTLGLIGIIIDTLLVLLVGAVVPGFYVEGFWWALLCAIIVNITRKLVAGK